MLVLRRLRAGCHLAEALVAAAHKAARQLSAQLAHSFFMPFCLTALAALARLKVGAACMTPLSAACRAGPPVLLWEGALCNARGVAPE